MLHAVSYITLALLALSFCYFGLAIAGVVRFGRRLRSAAPAGDCLPVTILKPLCGLETGLAENLRSFCEQDYASYQIVFGVRDRNDPAVPVIARLQADYPDRDIALVVADRTAGNNHKISNLANMMAVAKHDILAVSDSDMRVGPDYLRSIAAPFARGEVGAATCLYSGIARGGLASRLGAMFVNDWFLPSALLPAMAGDLEFCFGATMAVRRDVLRELGGFEALADYLADDYMLGQFVVRQGYRIALVPYMVENIIHEPGLKTLFLHELRWARTIRSVQPVGYTLSAITEILPLSGLAALAVWVASASALPAIAILASALAIRIGLHYAVCVALPTCPAFAPWLIPLRDLLSLSVRVASFFGSTVRWREQTFSIRANNQLGAAE